MEEDLVECHAVLCIHLSVKAGDFHVSYLGEKGSLAQFPSSLPFSSIPTRVSVYNSVVVTK